MKPKDRRKTSGDPMEALLDDREASAKTTEAAASAEDELDDHAYLGREFLAWLLHRVEQGEARFDGEAGEATFSFGGRAKLTATVGFATELTLKGRAPAAGAEMRAALGSGHALREAELRVQSGDQEWRCVLVADTLDLRGVKMPKGTDLAEAGAEVSERDEAAVRLADRLALLDALEAHLRAAYAAFMTERLAPRWHAKIVPAIGEWLAEGLKPERVRR